MKTEITSLFYDEHEHRHLVASGYYYPEERGGWLDGKRSEPDEPEYMELADITDEDGGEVDIEFYRGQAMKALWHEVEQYTVEDW